MLGNGGSVNGRSVPSTISKGRIHGHHLANHRVPVEHPLSRREQPILGVQLAVVDGPNGLRHGYIRGPKALCLGRII